HHRQLHQAGPVGLRPGPAHDAAVPLPDAGADRGPPPRQPGRRRGAEDTDRARPGAPGGQAATVRGAELMAAADARTWQVIDGGAVQVRLPRVGSEVAELSDLVRGLPSGTSVALSDTSRWARRRCRRFAAGAELE